MSEHAFQEFVEAAGKDPALAEEAQSAVGDRQGNEASAALAAYARTRGYDVSDDEVAAAMTAAAVPDGALSDDQLDGVAGGGLFGAFAGAAVGGVVGGPLGAIIGAGFGAKIL